MIARMMTTVPVHPRRQPTLLNNYHYQDPNVFYFTQTCFGSIQRAARQLRDVFCFLLYIPIPDPRASQNIATALGGLATPCSIMSGQLLKKKDHLSWRLHSSATSARRSNSPIMIPCPERRIGWRSISGKSGPAKSAMTQCCPRVGLLGHHRSDVKGLTPLFERRIVASYRDETRLPDPLDDLLVRLDTGEFGIEHALLAASDPSVVLLQSMLEARTNEEDVSHPRLQLEELESAAEHGQVDGGRRRESEGVERGEVVRCEIIW